MLSSGLVSGTLAGLCLIGPDLPCVATRICALLVLDLHVDLQDLKDFARQPGLDVVYSEVSRDRDGKGYVATCQKNLISIRSLVK